MTWASRSLAHSLTSTRLFLKRQLWIWPIIALVLLAAIGWGMNRAIEQTMKTSLESELQTLLSVETAMLQRWMNTQERNAESMANDGDVRRLVVQLLEVAGTDSGEERDAIVKQLASSLGPAMTSHGFTSFAVIDRDKIIVAGSDASIVGRQTPKPNEAGVTRALEGEPTILAPFPSVAAIVAPDGERRTGVPTMFVAAPVRDENLQVVAVLGLRINPLRDFIRILELGRIGESGETYAFNRAGLMLSPSRFERELMMLGLLPEGGSSMLQTLVRDPGGNLEQGFVRKQLPSKSPPTRLVAVATSGEPGVDVAGYRGYRGVDVVGAWTWLDSYDFGLAVEVNRADAFRPLTILKRTFWGMLALLAASSVAIFAFTVMLARAQRQARAAAIEAKQLGQYELEEKLGAGAMGVVYRGRHAMLRRPTAIKLLDADKVTEQSIARFEREVQITSQLNHPNTVAIYDFGRTPEDVFYYAMEFIEGINLQTLVEQYGPQPAGRVIHILRQVCGSLYEAHSLGLVHRDIKPANIMLSRRAAEADFVKVLDFGLVKARDDEPQAGENQSLAGTPLYMSPEAIQLPSSVDACSDLYAVGAVGYFLLTGRPVFEASSIVDLCNKHVAETPTPPSQRLGQPVPGDLENVVLARLEEARARRPQTARELSQRLARCAAAAAWTLEDAEAWWSRFERGAGAPPSAAPPTIASRHYEATIDQ